MRNTKSHVLGLGAALLVMFLLLPGAAVRAAGPAGADRAFWNVMSVRLQRVVPDKKATASSGDSGNTETPERSKMLYWKGAEPDIVVPEAELVDFNLALQDVVDGKRDEAVKSFDEFLTKYPNSTLADDARAALSELRGDKPKQPNNTK